MAVVAPSARARRVEAISGVLALFAGLGAIGVQLFAPMIEAVYAGSGYITYQSHSAVAAEYVTDPLGLAALGLCLFCLLAFCSGAVRDSSHWRLR